MPKNYAVVTEDEMTYVDGGIAPPSLKWWGVRLSLDGYEADVLSAALNVGAGAAALGAVVAGVPTGGTATIVLGIISAGLWIDSGMITLFNTINKNNGVYVDINWAGQVSFSYKR